MNPADDIVITPAVRAYLTAFDDWLRAPTPETMHARADALTSLKRSVAGKPLSPRQREVLDLRSHGVSRTGIAELLGITPKTVARHWDTITAKLGTCDPFRLAITATRLRNGGT